MEPTNLGPAPDAIRGVAAFLVALAHCWQVFLYPLDADAFAFRMLGGTATWSVATFFVLSGMLIALSIKRRTTSSGFQLREYVWARVLRIFPPLVLAVCLTVLVVYAIQGFGLYGSETYLLPGDDDVARPQAALYWKNVPTTLLLLYNLVPGTSYLSFNGPLWSLSYEFWLYILAGLAVAAFANRSWMAAAGAAALLFVMLFVSEAVPPFWSIAAVWGLGFAIGWHWTRMQAISGTILLACALACMGAALLVAGRQTPSFLVSAYGSFPEQVFYVCFSAAIACLIVAITRSARFDFTSRLGALISRSGTFSYTLYVIHFPLFLFLFSLLRPLVYPFGIAGHVVLAIFALTAVTLMARFLASFVENRQWLSDLIGKCGPKGGFFVRPLRNRRAG